MGNRRMGAQRLAALMKRGAQGLDTSYQAGGGIKNAVVSHKIIKYGGVIETQILVDLQGSGSAQIWSGDAARDVIGEATAEDGTGAVADASLMTWENDKHGIIFESEVLVVEAPTAGSTDIDVVWATKNTAFAQSTAVGSLTVAASMYLPGAALTVGDRVLLPVMDEQLDDNAPEATEIRWPNGTFVDLDGKALYLLAEDGGPGAEYTAGKFVIILRGMDTSWGF